MGPHGPTWGRKDFFLLIQTFPTFWAEQILILIFCIFIFLDPKFPDFQVSDFQISRNLALARLGPGLDVFALTTVVCFAMHLGSETLPR